VSDKGIVARHYAVIMQAHHDAVVVAKIRGDVAPRER
jgi:hypothetical protein